MIKEEQKKTAVESSTPVKEEQIKSEVKSPTPVVEERDEAGFPTNGSASSQNVKYSSNYGMGIFYAGLCSFIGWVLLISGFIAAIGLLPSYGSASQKLLATLPGLAIVILGVGLVAMAQFLRATLDNADHTREILKYLQQKGL